MLEAVLSGFVVSLTAPWLLRIGRAVTGWLIAVLPLGLVIYFARFIGPVTEGKTLITSDRWIPSLGINLSFHLDGLSLLFALLISGIGALVMIYAGAYLEGHPHLGRFYIYMLMFMASMLGVVLADHVITLFVFWELTSVSSYLLIGFDHEREAARAAALQALLVTGLGGLALLAGLVLLGYVGGSWELSVLLNRGETIRSDPLYRPILLLILIGAFTKSAQFPFHFWLPAAMEAPTPVSSYLHSATMVKAGVYLLARLHPVLGGTDEWHYAVTLAGATTMLVGAIIALRQYDLKQLLAYSTVSALGTLTLLLGLGTTLSIKAAMVFLLVHALYKGALFLIAGAVDHETGTRDVRQLSGLWPMMPITAMAGVLAALSMAGLPPLLGFISKELIYEAKLQAPQAGWLITTVGVMANIWIVAVAITVGIRPFIGSAIRMPNRPHEAPFSLWLGPVVLAGLSFICGLLPDLPGHVLLSPAASAARGEPTEIKLALWHGVSPVLALSVVTVACGLGVFTVRHRMQQMPWPRTLTGAHLYRLSLDMLNALARAQTRAVQTGYLRFYLLTLIVATVGLGGYTLMDRVELNGPSGWSDIRAHEWMIAIMMLTATVMVVRASSRLVAVAALGVVGYGVAVIFMLFGAPDLAITQFTIETLAVILFVLVLYRLPRFAVLSSPAARLRDALVALAAGGLMSILVVAASGVWRPPRLTEYFAQNSLLLAYGRNVVNVILVDFRSLDTLGEITVLAVAAIGIYALLRLRPDTTKESSSHDS